LAKGLKAMIPPISKNMVSFVSCYLGSKDLPKWRLKELSRTNVSFRKRERTSLIEDCIMRSNCVANVLTLSKVASCVANARTLSKVASCGCCSEAEWLSSTPPLRAGKIKAFQIYV
jgi:hypothetical protein